MAAALSSVAPRLDRGAYQTERQAAPLSVCAPLGQQIPPVRVGRLNQLKLPRPRPLLQTLLARDGFNRVGEGFDVDETMDRVLSREAVDGPGTMFGQASLKVARDPDVERATRPAGENANVKLAHYVSVRLVGPPVKPGGDDEGTSGGRYACS